MLKEDIIEAVHIFDEFFLTEKRQRKVFNNGVYFDFTYGDPDPYHRNTRLGVLEFATFLKTCKFYGIEVDANYLVDHPYDTRYENLVKMVSASTYEEKEIKVKKLGRKE